MGNLLRPLPIESMTNERLREEFVRYEHMNAYAAKHSLQAPMGYDDNCNYNYLQRLKAEMKRRGILS